MRIPLLPPKVELRLDRHTKDGKPLPDTPVFVCRPVGMLDAADYIGEYARTGNVGWYARAFAESLSHIDGLDIDGEHFDPKNPDHIAALDPVWAMELGRKLLSATKLTDEERGKSSSPSD